MADDLSTLRGRLRWARAQADLRAHVLSERAGLAAGHVGLIESGKIAQPQGDTLAVIVAQIPGLTLDWLMLGRGEMPTIAKAPSVHPPALDDEPSGEHPVPPGPTPTGDVTASTETATGTGEG